MDKLKIAIQGNVGSNHNLITQKLFPEAEIDFTTAKTFHEELDYLEDGKVDIAVMAIENSIAGSLLENFDLLSKHEFVIVGEGYLRIEHCLIGNPESTESDITTVYSQEIALKQCTDYIEKNDLQAVEYFDTAASVPHVLELGDKHAAGIAPAIAAEIYGGKILARGVETNKQNYTRFVVLTKPENQQRITTLLKKNQSNTELKTMIEVTLSHKPGSLVESLQILANCGFNLTKIESRPILGEAWQYRFYIDFVSTKSEEEIADLLKQLTGHVTYLRKLGTFPAGETFQP